MKYSILFGLFAACPLLTGCEKSSIKWSAGEVLWASLALLCLTFLILRAANPITVASAGSASRGKVRPFLFFSGLFLCIAGAKLHLIAGFGSDVPYWDQWPAEGLMYPPLLAGMLDPAQLISPHNEHRILLTRLLACNLLELNGQWDPLLQMAVNAVIHGLVLTGLALALWRLSGKNYLPFYCVTIALLGIIPFGWENTLAGFQSQFYFLLGFSLLTILILLRASPFSIPWFLGLASALLAQFSMASGFIAPVAVGCVLILSILLDRTCLNRYLPTILACMALAVIGFEIVPHVPRHDAMKVTVPILFMVTFGKTMAWPFNIWPLMPLMWAPLSILLWRRIRSRKLGDFEAFLICLGVWVLLQGAAMSYSRGAVGPTASRYCDLLSMGTLANFSALLILARDWLADEKRYRVAANLSALLLLLLGGLSVFQIPIPKPVLERHAIMMIEEVNTAGYITKGDAAFIYNKPFLHIPWISAQFLASTLADQSLREILPTGIRAPLPLKESECSGFSPGATPQGFIMLPHRIVYGSRVEERFDRALYLSQPIESRYPWLVFDIAGGGPGTSLEIIPAQGPAIPICLDEQDGYWQQVTVRAPEGSFRIRAADDKGAGFAFSWPREMATGGVITRRVCQLSAVLLMIGMLSILVGLRTASFKPANPDNK